MTTRRWSTGVIALTLLLPSLAAADEPAPGGALRIELGSAAEWIMDDDPPVMPSVRVGAGLRLSERFELSATLRHTFFPDLDEPYKEPVAYSDVSLGVRIYQPIGRVRLFIEPALLLSWWGEGNDQEVYDNSTPGASLRLGAEVPIDGRFSVGGGLGASLALGTEDFWVGFLSGELHVSARF